MVDRTYWQIALNDLEPPWGDRPSLFQHIRAHIRQGETGLTEGGEILPDEERVRSESGLEWAAGALDGAVGHHMVRAEGAERAAGAIHEALRELTEVASRERAEALYTLLTEHRALEYVDPLLEAIARDSDLNRYRLRVVARWLVTEAPDREPVKAGIALLGLFRGVHDRPLLQIFACHEEFTLYAAVALINALENPERDLFRLARRLRGWGHIQLVERLAGTQDEEIKAWLLREGYQNSVTYGYTAYVCATSGELLDALSSLDPDDALLKGAGDILAALIEGRRGPAEGIGVYADGAEVTELWLEHLQDRNVNLEQLVVVDKIRRFLEEEEGEAHDSVLGWPQRRAVLLEYIHAILSRPGWDHRIREGFASKDSRTFQAATEATRVFGIDAWDVYFERLHDGEGHYWYYVMQTDDPSRIDRVVALAEERLPLERIATGPADERDVGPEFEHHRALDYLLLDLGRFPGKGWPLIRAGLQSPVTRNRHMALRALAAWGKQTWPNEAETLLRRTLDREPNEDTRDYMRRVLAGESLDF